MPIAELWLLLAIVVLLPCEDYYAVMSTQFYIVYTIGVFPATTQSHRSSIRACGYDRELTNVMTQGLAILTLNLGINQGSKTSLSA
jgi:hypothetical protein